MKHIVMHQLANEFVCQNMPLEGAKEYSEKHDNVVMISLSVKAADWLDKEIATLGKETEGLSDALQYVEDIAYDFEIKYGSEKGKKEVEAVEMYIRHMIEKAYA